MKLAIKLFLISYVSIIIPIIIFAKSPIVDSWYYATVKIENEWGNIGTGFLVFRETKPNMGRVFLCTTKHVLHKKRRMRNIATIIKCHLTISKNNKIESSVFNIGLVSSSGEKIWNEHPDSTIDVLVFDVTDLYNNHPEILKKYAPYKLIADSIIISNEEITIAEEILVLGYPLGYKQGDTNFPIVRQGIIASQIGSVYGEDYIDSTGTKRTRVLRGFLIDGGSIPGSSGSPVVLKPVMGRIVGRTRMMKTATPYLLGILAETRYAPIRTKIGDLRSFAGLGFAFDAITIQETIELFFD